jgi:hypothetical protein
MTKSNHVAEFTNILAQIDADQALIYQKQEEIGTLWEEIMAILYPPANDNVLVNN